MRRGGHAQQWLLVMVWITAVSAAGCAQQSAGPAARKGPSTGPSGVTPITNTDPCASRLHDLCGPLLLYYSAEGHLPERLDELAQVGGQAGPLVCPASGRPYVYNPNGLPGPEAGTRVIIYDPLPSHSGVRWGISIRAGGEGEPLIAKVIALPESSVPRASAR